VQAQKKSEPLGVYVVTPVDDNLPAESCWTDPNVIGVTFRLNWSDIEPNAPPAGGEGEFQWAYFDQGLALCQTNGKYAVLSVDCGRTAPGWVPGQKFPLHTLYKGNFNEIEPWDPQFQAAVAHFIAKFGQRYDSNPLVLGISIWAGGWSTECQFAESQQDTNTLNAPPYNGPAIWLNAAETIAGYYAQAFPTTNCYIAAGVPIIDGKVTMTTLETYCQSLGMGVQCNELAPNIPWVSGDTPPGNPNYAEGYIPYTNLRFDSSPTQVPLVRYQLLFPLGTNGPNGTTPMGTDLGAVLTNGLHAGANNIEIYSSDQTYGWTGSGIYNPAMATFNQEVGAP
jgi:hypothetical protein